MGGCGLLEEKIAGTRQIAQYKQNRLTAGHSVLWKAKTAKFSRLLKWHRVTQSHCRVSQENGNGSGDSPSQHTTEGGLGRQMASLQGKGLLVCTALT